MNILHINVSAICDKFYVILFDKLSEFAKPYVYCPYSERENTKESVAECRARYKEKKIQVYLCPIKKSLYKIFYFTKIRAYSIFFIKNRRNNYDIIHAHSLYTDGGCAYWISKRYKIPFIVAVRGTDTMEFMKYFKHLNYFARKILESASFVIFITPDQKRLTIRHLYGSRKPKWLDRSIILPNGIDDFWLKNLNYSTKSISLREKKLKLIQVSRLVKYKNIDKTILATAILRKWGYNVELTIVGEGPELNRLKGLTSENGLDKHVIFSGFINDKSELLAMYRSNDIFILPSLGETFGISYIEALSQGLPIIGLDGAGVSGYLKESRVGCFLQQAVPELIASSVVDCLENYKDYSINAKLHSNEFKWESIITKYKEIYKIAQS